MPLEKEGGFLNRDLSQYIWDSEGPSWSTVNAETGSLLNNTFEKVCRINLDSCQGTNPLFSNLQVKIQVLAAGKIDFEILLVSQQKLLQYAKVSGLISFIIGDPSYSYLSELEVVEYREFLDSDTSNGPMQIGFNTNVEQSAGQTYPYIGFYDGSNDSAETVIIKVKIFGAVSGLGDDTYFQLIPSDNDNIAANLGPLPLPVSGVYSACQSSDSDTVPILAEKVILATGAISGPFFTTTLQPASSYNVGTMIWFKDAGGVVNDTNNWSIQAAGSDTIDFEESSPSVNMTHSFDSVILMSDGVSNWMCIAPTNTTIMNTVPICGGIYI